MIRRRLCMVCNERPSRFLLTKHPKCKRCADRIAYFRGLSQARREEVGRWQWVDTRCLYAACHGDDELAASLAQPAPLCRKSVAKTATDVDPKAS